ncbi:hypothetical protein AAF712_008686 [Marasmius tenuissimus]|uniref:Uncharacterized protein n=1 Tax=Marasmius tenuissimus TaxID=585030 RepID=A0ABR2ZRT4_9AGAR
MPVGRSSFDLRCFPFLFRFTFYFSTVIGSPHFRTIDDTFGDSAIDGALPRYSSGNWTPRPGDSCGNCKLNPNDTGRIMHGTWHDTTHIANAESLSMELTFTGIAISVFCILPPKSAEAIVDYNLSFTLDGRPVGSFTRTRDELKDEYQYNVSVISLVNLENQEHAFRMEMAKSSNVDLSFSLTTQLIYEGIITEKKKPNLGAILGGLFGTLAFLTGTALLFAYSRRRRADVFTAQAAQVFQPFISSAGQMHVGQPHANGRGNGEEGSIGTCLDSTLCSIPSPYSYNPPSQLDSNIKSPHQPIQLHE